MKSFLRSLTYLKPYRARLIAAALLVILLAALWGGGLGMLLPGMKILIDPQGLHGWAYSTMVQDRLGGQIVSRTAPVGTEVDDQPLFIVLDVISVRSDSPLAKGKVHKNEEIVGLYRDGQQRIIRGDELMRELALHDTGGEVDLIVYSPETGQTHRSSVEPKPLSFSSRLLGTTVGKIPQPKTRDDRVNIWLGLLTIVVVVTVLRNVCRFAQEYLVASSVMAGMWDLREECYNSALRQPLTFYATAGTSDTMSRFVQDSNELAQAQNTLFGKTLAEPAKAIASITVAMIFSWKLTLVAMVAGPIAFAIIRTFGKMMKRASKRALASWADMLTALEETLQGLRVVKAYTMEASERKRFHRVNRALYKQQRRMARIDAASSPSIELIGMFFGMGAAGYAGGLVLMDKMDPYVFISWMGALAAMFDPVRKLSKVVTRFQRGDAAAERMFEIRDREHEKRLPGAPQLPALAQSLQFENVQFAYPGGKEQALRDVNLEIAAGQSVAIVGPNGSGKTTLVSLVPRLLDPTGGRILLDGCDITTHSLRSLRKQIAVVTQETIIFNATIAENIAYGRRRASEAEILNAAKQAFVDEFVAEMPDGYHTMVGQRGATLSGGQRQRIAIARAILRDPAILIFDEALSQVDPDSELRIAQAMETFIKGRTTLMIAHRFSTIRSADAIVVMDGGRIVDIARHEVLMDRCELYRHLYKTQFGGE